MDLRAESRAATRIILRVWNLARCYGQLISHERWPNSEIWRWRLREGYEVKEETWEIPGEQKKVTRIVVFRRGRRICCASALHPVDQPPPMEPGEWVAEYDPDQTEELAHFLASFSLRLRQSTIR